MIKVFNTGASYTKHGQRIAYMEIAKEVSGGTLVAFYDGDRCVSNVVRIPSHEPVTNDTVMREYLHCNYQRQFIIPGALEDELRRTAQSFQIPQAEIERIWVLSAFHLPGSVYQSFFTAGGGVLELHDGYSLMVDIVGNQDGVVIRIPQPDELLEIGSRIDADLYAVLTAGFGMGVQAVKFDRDAEAAPDAFGLRWFHGD